MRIDCDIHPHLRDGLHSLFPYMTEAWRHRLGNQELAYTSQTSRLHDEGPKGSNPHSVAKALFEEDRASAAVLVPLQVVNCWTDGDLATSLVAAINDHFVTDWLPVHPGFKLAICAIPQDPARSAIEIKRHAGTKGVCAVFLPLVNILMGNRHYQPILAAAVEAGLPIIVHPTGAEGNYVGAPVTAAGKPRSAPEKRVGLAQIAQANVNSLIYEGTFARFPELKVIFAEWGFAWVPPLLWRMDIDWVACRIETPWVKVKPSEFLARHLRFTTSSFDGPADEKELASILRMCAAKQTLLYGSNYPHGDPLQADALSERLPYSLRERVFAQTALETFNGRI
jgi:predicted TIM-barrel fold metal-dependent hydrolase